jgi:hypothetical protein
LEWFNEFSDKEKCFDYFNSKFSSKKDIDDFMFNKMFQIIFVYYDQDGFFFFIFKVMEILRYKNFYKKKKMNEFKSMLLDVLLTVIDDEDLNKEKYEKHLNKYILKYENNKDDFVFDKNEIFTFIKNVLMDDYNDDDEDEIISIYKED